MKRIDFTKLIQIQKDLDAKIASNHHISYQTTRDRRILSLLVEIGELANTTRCFKYWSNKGKEKDEIILDEYADGLHFFLSLGIDINSTKVVYDIKEYPMDLTKQFLKTYELIIVFSKEQDMLSYTNAFQCFLNLIPLLGYKPSQIVDAYLKKVDVNYQRQETNY